MLVISFGCQQDELVKPNALLSESSLTFEAIGAEPQLLTVASDSDWSIDTPEWITVDPSSGSQTVKVTVSVSDNVKNGKEAAPRQASIIITNSRGYSIETLIYQKGDAYLDAKELSISEAARQEDGVFVKIPEASVAAVTAEGFVISEGGASMYVTSKEKVNVGDKVYVAGKKVTLYSLSSLEVGEVRILSAAEFTQPAAVDLIGNLDPSKADKVVYAYVEAGLLGRALQFEQEVPVQIELLDSNSDIDLDAVNMHNVLVHAYYVGMDKDVVKLAVVDIEDKGINDNLKAYFYDDFSWMKSFIEASGVKVDDSVGDNNASGAAPNLRTTGSLAPLLEEFLARGYQDLNAEAKVIYPQKFYWKFGKTDNHGGIVLPHIEFKGSELINVVLNFDWSAHMTGSGNIDKVQIVVEVEGPGFFENGTSVSEPFMTDQVKGQLAWQHASVLIKGVNDETKITIRPLNFAEAIPDQQRWHLDNIKIVDSDIPYSDPVFANLSVSDEVVTFEGNPAGPAEVKITSDNAWTLSKAADTDWFDIDVTEGAAGEEKTVTITCQPSNSVTLRRGVITIASADTRKNIHVVQSAAGGELDALISIVGGNYVTVLGEGEEFSAKVQANVDYEIEASEWISVVPVPDTKALVEVREHRFSAAPNTTGAARTGFVKFRQGQLEAVLNVTQDNFVPRIDMTASNVFLGVSGLAHNVYYAVDANIPYSVSTDASWITLPASSGNAGTYVVPVGFSANVSDNVRTATVTLTNAEYDYEKTIEIRQFGAGILFADDFSWLKPLVNAMPSGNYDTVGSQNLGAAAPNIYTTKDLKAAFVPLAGQIGYYIPGKADGANDVLYLQDCYLKMGKTSSSSQTSMTLPAFDIDGTAPALVLSFDWARMIQGTGTVDDYTLTLMITGNGSFENGTKYSEPLSTPQAKVAPVDNIASELFWTNVSAKVIGADKDTRITLVATALLDTATGKIDYTKTGGRRMFIDNIVVKAD